MTTRKQLAEAVEARLRTIENVAGYIREVPATPPTISPDDPRVRPYWVLHTGAGAPEDERLAGEMVGLAFAFQVTLAVGVGGNLDHFTDVVTDLLSGWRPFDETSRCWPPTGYDPGPGRPDYDVAPPRFWTPLQFVIHT